MGRISVVLYAVTAHGPVRCGFRETQSCEDCLPTVYLFFRTGRLLSLTYFEVYAEKAEAEASKDAYIFNCAQRAHQNTLENITPVVTAFVSSLCTYRQPRLTHNSIARF